MHSSDRRVYFFLVLLVGAAILVASISAPFFEPLGLAAVCAVVLAGLRGRVARLVGERPNTTAFVTLLLGLLLIVVPLALVGSLVAQQATDLYGVVASGGGQSVVTSIVARVNSAAGGMQLLPTDLPTDVSVYAKQALQWVVQNSGSLFSGLSSFFVSLLLFCIALFYFLRDGALLRRALVEFSPFSDTADEHVLSRLEMAVNSVIKGNLMVALIQGGLTMLGFTLFGVPNAILWGAVTAVAALIPGLGTGLVFLPVVLYLYISGATASAAGVLLWGVLAVGLIDNFLGPKLVGRGMQLHPLLVLIAVLGGLLLFGPTGVIFGPLAMSLFFTLLSIYAEETRSVRGV